MSNSGDGDIWSRWLLHRRDADDPEVQKRAMQLLRPARDTVLDNARLQESDILLDVGCGDGLIAFGALERTSTGQVIFCDISADLLDYVRAVATDLDVIARCSFVNASAEDLSPLPDGSVSVVTTRSVLIYVADKAAAFREFYRVLESGGRISIFEPINSFGYPPPDNKFAGYDVAPVVHLARKVKAVFLQAQPDQNNPMLDFDERDLIRFARDAGFQKIHLRLDVRIFSQHKMPNWETFLNQAPNPLAPTLKEAISESLTPSEARDFLTHLRTAVEQQRGLRKGAAAYLWAGKGGER